jgi:EpsG-like putative glucosyltransferase
MWPYWLIFLLPLAGVNAQYRTGNQRLAWFFLLALLSLFIGLRYQVGGDWGNYLRHFDSMRYIRFADALSLGDPAYYVINWILADAGLSIAWVNLLCATIVCFGVHAFCRNQPLPWLALTVAIPYLLIVVSMGYTRQATALGLALIGLTALAKDNNRQFVFWVLLGALFHKSAVLLLPIAALAATKNRLWTSLWVSIFVALSAYSLLLDSAEQMWQNYVVDAYAQASQGGAIRVLMNAVPAMILLLFRNKLFYDSKERRLWTWMALLSLATIPMLSISATAVDRVALYFIPLQMFVFSRLPFVARNTMTFNSIVYGTVAYYALVQFVWLNFALHAYAWLPYRNFLFQ